MNMPNFLVIGAPRAGTTALHYYLAQHPQIYMSAQKEPNYFAFDNGKLDLNFPEGEAGARNLILHSTPTREAYEALFRGATSEIAIGDISPYYLSSPGAAQRIQQQLPSVKLIAILRDPVDRAYSHFTQLARSRQQNPADFPQILTAEEADQVWGFARFYLHQGLYFAHLSRYWQHFPPEQIKIYRYEEFEAQPLVILQDLFQFLGVDSSYVPNTQLKYNTSGVAKNRALDVLLSRRNPLKPLLKKVLPVPLLQQLSGLQNRLQNKNLAEAPTLPADLRRSLIQRYFQQDILNLQSLIQQDLSAWLK
jgi:Sulfotransferase family